MTSFSAFRFDGRNAAALPVRLRVENRWLVVEAPDGAALEREALERAEISDPLHHAPRLVYLPGGVTLEVADEGRAFSRALEQNGVRTSVVVALQSWWPAAVLALGAMMGLLAIAYFKVLPLTARWLVFALPTSVEETMGTQLLTLLDRHQLRPSRRDPAERARITRQFAAAAERVAPGVPYRVEFRDTAKPSVNAMAIPGGTIVILDGLIDFAESDDAVLGVLGHELGHVVHKHSARQLVQSVGMGSLAALMWGDFSGLAANVPVVLGMLHHSRAFEQEADEFALDFLRAGGISAAGLLEFFIMVSDTERHHATGGIPDFLSTHPATGDRIGRLRREVEREPATP